jgi:hypothetical protein
VKVADIGIQCDLIQLNMNIGDQFDLNVNVKSDASNDEACIGESGGNDGRLMITNMQKCIYDCTYSDQLYRQYMSDSEVDNESDGDEQLKNSERLINTSIMMK